MGHLFCGLEIVWLQVASIRSCVAESDVCMADSNMCMAEGKE